MSSLECKALCIVLDSVVLCPICLSSFFVYFKNDAEYLIRVIAQVFIPLMKFLSQSLVSKSFLFFLGRLFLRFLSFLFI